MVSQHGYIRPLRVDPRKNPKGQPKDQPEDLPWYPKAGGRDTIISLI